MTCIARRNGRRIASFQTTTTARTLLTTAVALAAVLPALPARAAPDGGVITAGAGTISQQGATTTINQSATQPQGPARMVINWNSFSSAAGESIVFNQPNVKDAAAGAVIRSDQVDRGLLLLNDMPGVGAVRATLQPGEKVGSSDMVLELDPGQRYAGNLAIDNHGNRYTGNVRMSGSVVLNNLSGIGDQLTGSGLFTTQKLAYGRLAYSLPIGGDGMRAAFAYSSTRYQLAREFAALDAHGRANSLGVTLAYPFIRRQRAMLSGSISLESKRLTDHIGATETVNAKRARVFNIGLAGNFQDALGGGAVSSVELSSSFGKLEIESPSALAIDDVTVRTNGSYTKLSFAGNRLQRLTDQDQLWLALSGQRAQNNLDSSEKFLLGGPGGVRAYPQGEGIGDDGYLATVELRHNFGEALQGTVFYDAGSVKLNHTAYDLSATNRRTLAGAGLGFNAVLAGTDLRASLAWRTVGGEPLSVPADTSKSPTLWVRANRPF